MRPPFFSASDTGFGHPTQAGASEHFGRSVRKVINRFSTADRFPGVRHRRPIRYLMRAVARKVWTERFSVERLCRTPVVDKTGPPFRSVVGVGGRDDLNHMEVVTLA